MKAHPEDVAVQADDGRLEDLLGYHLRRASTLDMNDFIAHFADVSLWHTEIRDFLLLGRTERGPLDSARARALWGTPALEEDARVLHLVAP